MNYYEHHIRDYDAATLHLSWDEDMAYTRLLRWYYRKERPIPPDIKEVCRLMRATSKPQRDAVEAVLNEFFELREDGWHQDTCDDVIAEYRAGEPDREAKKKNEETRSERHRAERRTLFALINEAGEHMAWNAPIAQVRELAETIRARNSNDGSAQPATAPATPGTAPRTASNAPATPTVTAPATPVTATQTPVPTPHSPLPRVEEEIRSEADASAAAAAPAMPMTVKDRVWSLGIAMLGEKCRSKLGKLVSTHGEAIVLDALRAAAIEQPGDPYPWLVAACEARAKAPRANGSRRDAQPPTTEDLLARDPHPPWLAGTGFPDVFAAESAGCGPGNAARFRDGQRAAA